MSDENAPVVITNRDVYNLLKDHIDSNRAWQEQHQAADTAMFTKLNIKFFGILAAIATVLVALAIPHT